MSDYGYAVEVAEGYDEAVVRARMALKGEGFSIITEMHVGGMLGAEAGDERQYLIMGAWAPPAGSRPIDEGIEAAIHLPCNVVVQENGESAVVAMLDPAEDLPADDPATAQVAEAARAALGRVLTRVASHAGA